MAGRLCFPQSLRRSSMPARTGAESRTSCSIRSKAPPYMHVTPAAEHTAQPPGRLRSLSLVKAPAAGPAGGGAGLGRPVDGESHAEHVPPAAPDSRLPGLGPNTGRGASGGAGHGHDSPPERAQFPDPHPPHSLPACSMLEQATDPLPGRWSGARRHRSSPVRCPKCEALAADTDPCCLWCGKRLNHAKSTAHPRAGPSHRPLAAPGSVSSDPYAQQV